MIRILLVLFLLLLGVAAYVWFGSQSTPAWVQEEAISDTQTINRLSKQIEQRGVANFLGDKFADVMRGEVVLNEDEFNALLQASLASHKDGRRLLRVSDVVRARLNKDEIEVGALINLAKVREVEPKSREALKEALAVLPFDPGDKVFVAVRGKPVARDGNLGVSQDVSLQIGSVPISSGFLSSLGVPMERLEQESVPLQLLNIRSAHAEDGQIRFGVRPKF